LGSAWLVWREAGFQRAKVALLLFAAQLVAFWRIQRVAAVLLVPYLAWVSFTAALTLALWHANPELLS
jgi:tryptophan-rich sensory protein